MKKFTLSHLVLYSKGWYKTHDNHEKSPRKNIWDDLKQVLSNDFYMDMDKSGYEQRERITSLIVDRCSQINNNHFSLNNFYVGISEGECWKYGYPTIKNNFYNGNFPEYDYYEAVVRYCLSGLCYLSTNEWVVVKPDFKKILPRKNRVSQNKVEKLFN